MSRTLLAGFGSWSAAQQGYCVAISFFMIESPVSFPRRWTSIAVRLPQQRACQSARRDGARSIRDIARASDGTCAAHVPSAAGTTVPGASARTGIPIPDRPRDSDIR
jgi:hypothetical protein